MFVLTHRPPDTTPVGVTFLTGDLEAAVATARAAASGKNLEILGADLASHACSAARVRDCEAGQQGRGGAGED